MIETIDDGYTLRCSICDAKYSYTEREVSNPLKTVQRKQSFEQVHRHDGAREDSKARRRRERAGA